MKQDELHPLPSSDPVSGEPFYVSELTCAASGVSLRGKFALPPYVMLDSEQRHYLEVFLRCRGNLSCVEKELGMSYPTARTRLDAVLKALNFTPMREDSDISAEQKRRVLEQLERGEITAQEAKVKLKVKS